MEDKRERFIRIAEGRTNKIIAMIKLLGNCSNKSVYDFTEKDVEKIFGAIEAELRESKRKFSNVSTKNKKFTLE